MSQPFLQTAQILLQKAWRSDCSCYFGSAWLFGRLDLFGMRPGSSMLRLQSGKGQPCALPSTKQLSQHSMPIVIVLTGLPAGPAVFQGFCGVGGVGYARIFVSCTHGRCYAVRVSLLSLAHMVDATQRTCLSQLAHMNRSFASHKAGNEMLN